MTKVLIGSYPSALAAGIILISRSRALGLSLDIVVERKTFPELYAPVIASSSALCAIGFPQVPKVPNVAFLGGDSAADLLVNISQRWIYIDRSGRGRTKPAKQFIEMLRHPSRAHSGLGIELLYAARNLGLYIEPGYLDLLFAEELSAGQRLLAFLSASGGKGKLRRSSDQRGSLFSYFKAPGEENNDSHPSGIFKRKYKTRLLRWFDEVAKLPEYKDFYDAICALLKEIGQDPMFPQLIQLTVEDLALSQGLRAALSATEHQNPKQTHFATKRWTAAPIQIVEDRFLYLGGRILEQSQINLSNSLSIDIKNTTPFTEFKYEVEDIGEQAGLWSWFINEIENGVEQSEAVWQLLHHPHH